jgi:DNA-binding NarL/FixJ family response regulator
VTGPGHRATLGTVDFIAWPPLSRTGRRQAVGHPNRQVAQALFLSPKTVEANLASIYRKLGISSRAELGGAIVRARPPDLSS